MKQKPSVIRLIIIIMIRTRTMTSCGIYQVLGIFKLTSSWHLLGWYSRWKCCWRWWWWWWWWHNATLNPKEPYFGEIIIQLKSAKVSLILQWHTKHTNQQTDRQCRTLTKLRANLISNDRLSIDLEKIQQIKSNSSKWLTKILRVKKQCKRWGKW